MILDIGPQMLVDMNVRILSLWKFALVIIGLSGEVEQASQVILELHRSFTDLAFPGKIISLFLQILLYLDGQIPEITALEILF